MSGLLIRNETESDYAAVENITREAFWNIHVPGCNEHYLVHIMRKHADFIPELDFVAELDGRVIGNVMYTRSRLADEAGKIKPCLTFGPVSILPEYQNRGYGRLLLERSFEAALERGHEVIVIFGNPARYVGRGFKSCRRYNICIEGSIYPSAMLVKELKPGALDGRKWFFYESSAYAIADGEAEEFDKGFAPKEKEYRPSQEEFYIHSHSAIR
ncbi:MAG: GNAT family N-acetyltransferase [Christensenellales bacterium]